MTRSRLDTLLARAVAAGTLTQPQADAILDAWDAGAITERDLPEDLRDRDDDAALVVVALSLLRRAKTARAGGWAYDAASRRYVIPAGRRVVAQRAGAVPAASRAPRVTIVEAGARRKLDPTTVRAIYDATLDRAQAEIVRAGQLLKEGRIPLATWYEAIEQGIIVRETMSAALARGGIERLTDADKLFIRERALAQYDFLDKFADQLISGVQKFDGRYDQRIISYAQASRATYEAMRARVATEGGLTETLNILGISDHCAAESGYAGCLNQTRLGWHALDDPRHVEIGRRQCQVRCRCVSRYRAPRTEAA